MQSKMLRTPPTTWASVAVESLRVLYRALLENVEYFLWLKRGVPEYYSQDALDLAVEIVPR
jgi:hypothetical protein